MAKACNLARWQERKVKNSPCVRTPYFQPFGFQNWALSARVSQLSIKSLARESLQTVYIYVLKWITFLLMRVMVALFLISQVTRERIFLFFCKNLHLIHTVKDQRICTRLHCYRQSCVTDLTILPFLYLCNCWFSSPSLKKISLKI